MLEIIRELMRKKKKKYVIATLSVIVPLLFILLIDTAYRCFSDGQLANAYGYGGTYDICAFVGSFDAAREAAEANLDNLRCISMESDIFSARLDKTQAADLSGKYVDFVTHFYSTIIAAEEGSKGVHNISIKNGRWPENADEIIIPETFFFNGKTPRDGSMAVGDVLTLEV